MAVLRNNLNQMIRVTLRNGTSALFLAKESKSISDPDLESVHVKELVKRKILSILDGKIVDVVAPVSSGSSMGVGDTGSSRKPEESNSSNSGFSEPDGEAPDESVVMIDD